MRDDRIKELLFSQGFSAQTNAGSYASQHSANGELLEVHFQFNRAGSAWLTSGRTKEEFWKRLALSGTDIGVNRPRAYGYLSAGGNPSTGSPIEPYVVNGPIFLNVGSVESGTQPMNIWVLYR